MINPSSLIGFVTAIVIVVYSSIQSVESTDAFINVDSILIVAGGTLAAAIISFPFSKVLILTKVFFRRVLGISKRDYKQTIQELENLNDSYLQGKKYYEMKVNDLKDPFLKEAAQVLFWMESDISTAMLRELLEQRADTMVDRYNQDARIFQTLAKFPPAFGLIGTTLGMIGLLQSLGGDGKSNIGPAMSVALLTTLYGAVLSNMFFTPVAENLKQQAQDDDVVRRLVVEGIVLIERRLPTKFVREKLRSYLLPSER